MRDYQDSSYELRKVKSLEEKLENLQRVYRKETNILYEKIVKLEEFFQSDLNKLFNRMEEVEKKVEETFENVKNISSIDGNQEKKYIVKKKLNYQKNGMLEEKKNIEEKREWKEENKIIFNPSIFHVNHCTITYQGDSEWNYVTKNLVLTPGKQYYFQFFIATSKANALKFGILNRKSKFMEDRSLE